MLMNYYAGIDIGLANTGVVVVRWNHSLGFEYIDGATITTNSGDRLGERLNEIYFKVGVLLGKYDETIDCVALEQPFNSHKVSCGYSAAIMAINPAKPQYEFKPSVVKRLIAKHGIKDFVGGASDKKLVELSVKQLVNGLPANETDHFYDAAAIACCGRWEHRGET